MKLQVYDSWTRKKQPLLAPGKQELGIYVCGPTVYQRIHIGNARTYVTFVVFAKYLRSIGIGARLVSNITDLNDKIYAAAKDAGIPSAELAEQATQWYIEDTDRLGIGRPDEEPRATQSVPAMVTMIEELIGRDLAYEAGGDVYFRVEKFGEYGRLSNQQPDQMVAGSRDNLEDGDKQGPLDFALWKATKPGEDTSWDSPWGKGRPGWHIECSAMCDELLGGGFDIHGGGLDLIFPHHENEVAQSKGSGREFARLWMHGGMLEIAGGKMSKSEGNISVLKDVLDEWPAWVVLMLFYSASYRNPLEYSTEALEGARTSGQRIMESLRRSERYLASVETRGAGDPTFADSSRHWEGIHEALQDDFNMPSAMGEVFGLVYDLNTAVNEHATPQLVRDLRGCIMEFLDMFGLGELRPQAMDLTQEVKDLLAGRERARQKKDFDESDRIRDLLHEMGYVVRDTSDGSDVVPVGESGEADGEADIAAPDEDVALGAEADAEPGPNELESV